MEYSFNLQMAQMHAILGWSGLLVVLLRGVVRQVEPLARYDDPLRILMLGVWVLLAVTGLSLWYLFDLHPLRDAWLAAKLLGLVAYFALAHWALGGDELRVGPWVTSLLMLGWILALSATRRIGLGLF